MDGDDYIVVMVYVNQYCMLRIGCEHPHFNQLNLAN
jgi:hypothetical protein